MYIYFKSFKEFNFCDDGYPWDLYTVRNWENVSIGSEDWKFNLFFEIAILFGIIYPSSDTFVYRLSLIHI